MHFKKILILGYFGYKNNQLDGQTIKTRSIYSLFKNNYPHEVCYFDTQSFRESKRNVIRMIKSISENDILYYLPAHNNLKYLFPIIWCISKLSNTKINYLVVGGWLDEFLINKPLHRYLLARINGIYVETDTLYNSLTSRNFRNVFKLHNFRTEVYPHLDEDKPLSTPIRLVFMARINPKKGVNLIFELDKVLSKHNLENVTIDLYGPIAKEYEKDFFNKLKHSSSIINYCGVLQPNCISKTLQRYDLLLFPTKFYTEGFPGTILDSYISGIPVIATNWLNAKEFIRDGKTGYTTPFDNDQAFIEKVLYILNNSQQILEMKIAVSKIRYRYSSERAWQILKKSMIL